MNKHSAVYLLLAVSVGSLCSSSAFAQTNGNRAQSNGMILHGGVSTQPMYPTFGIPGTGMTVLPSIAGPAVINANGQLVGVMSMQNGFPTGTLIVPSAVGPIVLGSYGEFRGTMESFSRGKSKSPPLFGMGPSPTYSAVEAVQTMRSLFTPGGSSFPLNGPMMMMPVTAGGATNNAQPMVQTGSSSSYARIIPRSQAKSTARRR